MQAVWLGRVEYGAAWDLQKDLVALRAGRRIPDTLLLLEHPPTITLGRGARAEHLLVTPDRLAELGVALHAVDRGGDVTYHGPGQLVGYPIFDLSDQGRDLHEFLRRLEAALIGALAELGLQGRRFAPHTGVWIGEKKIAAIGIKVARWITCHGFALNAATDGKHFGLIVPCGIHDFGVTDVTTEVGRPVLVTDVLGPVVRGVSRAFSQPGMPLVEPSALAESLGDSLGRTTSSILLRAGKAGSEQA